MKLVVGGHKGGTGKSTIATNLAVCIASLNKKVLLIDADEQRSSAEWADQREHSGINSNITTVSLLGKSINQQILKLAQDYDEVIIDTGGRDTTSQRSALTVADAFLLPFKPRSFDVWTLGSIKTLLQDILSINEKLKCFYVINQGDARGHDNLDARQIIEEIECLKPVSVVIGHRKAFANAAADGLGVIELTQKCEKSVSEIWELCISVYGKHIKK